MAKLTIVRLRETDTDRLRAIRLRALREAPSAFCATYEETAARPLATWQQQLRDLATFVATIDGQDAGMVRGRPHPTEEDAAELLSMWVAPEARRRGMGRMLIESVASWARTEGHHRLFLEVVATNEAALALYLHAGFQLWEPEKPGELALVLAL